MKAISKALAGIGAIAVMIGCGGGGGGGATTGGQAGNARVGIFVTDDLSTAYDHVWVTIHRVEIKGPANNETVYSNATGKVIDLRALNQAGNQIFAMLGEAAVPAGNYTHVEVTLDDDVVLFPTGATTGLERKFAGSQANGTKDLKFNLTQQTISGAMDIVADFDLSQWTEDGALVHAVVVQGSGGGVQGNQQRHEFKGSVSNLAGSAPNFSFDLTQGAWTMKVVTSSATTIFNSNGAQNPVLANGQIVEVKGLFDTTSRVLDANSIKIKIGEDAFGGAEVEGAASNIGTDSFDLSTMQVTGFVPTSTTVKVQLTGSTRYFSNGGVSITKDEFLTGLATLGFGEAEGIYNAETNTITATKVKLEDEGGDDDGRNESEVEGTVGSINSTDGTFSVTVQKWEGTLLTPGSVVRVITNAGTEFKKSSRTEFFAALRDGETVEVKGFLEGDTLTAERVEIED